MLIYKVPVIGSGVEEDPFRPDLPPGVSWVGAGNGSEMLVKVRGEIPGLQPLSEGDVRREAPRLGLDPEEVLSVWAPGGEA